MSVQGAICREVKDVRLATEVMARADPRDPWWSPVPFHGVKIDTPIKVAVTRESHGYPIHGEILAGIDRAAGYLRDAGYIVEEVEVPSVLPAAKAWFNVALFEVKQGLGALAEQYGSDTIRNIFQYYYDMSDMVDLAGYMAGVAERTGIARQWTTFLAEYPLVLTPFLMRPTYDYDHDETYAGAKDIFDAAVYSFAMNYMGLPAGNVPIGLVEGRPSGIQIVGQRFREDLILDALEVIEQNVGILAHQLWARE